MHPPSTSSTIALTDERAMRQREVDNAVFVQALFGRSPSASVREQLYHYVLGELSREAAFAGLYNK